MAGATKSTAKSATKPAAKSTGKAKPGPVSNVAPKPQKTVATAAAKAEKVKAPKPEAPAKSDGAPPKASKADAAAKAVKVKKQKLVRDSFTMPESEYASLGEVKKACLANGFEVKKSELLRVGVALIRTLDNASLKNWIQSLPPLKPGRPRKEKAA